MKKRILSLLLAALMLASAVSCAADPAEETKADAETPAAEAVETEPEETKRFLDNVPEDLTFTGSDFNVLVRQEREDTTLAFELIGETVNDAITERTLMLEHRFEFTIMPTSLVSPTTGGASNWAATTLT